MLAACLFADPFERGTDSIEYGDRFLRHSYVLMPAQASFKEFPPRAKAASISISDVMDKITTADDKEN